jgi:hypothetical protein
LQAVYNSVSLLFLCQDYQAGRHKEDLLYDLIFKA